MTLLLDTSGNATSTIEGTLDKVRFAAEDSDWMVATLRPDDRTTSVTIVGNLLGARPGEWLKLEGTWKHHARFGRQFEVSRVHVDLPSSPVGIERYLAGVEGIGPVLASRIVARFGTRTFDVIDEDAQTLREVDGIGAARADKIQAIWQKTSAERAVTVFLLSHGVTAAYARRIIATYGDDAVAQVQKDPYRLARDVHGIGFLLADRIAAELGIVGSDPRRIKAGIVHVLADAEKQGHTFLPATELVERAREFLSTSPADVENGLEALRAQRRLVLEPTDDNEIGLAVFRYSLHGLEVSCADDVARLMAATNHAGLNPGMLASAIQRAEIELDVTLAPSQRLAVESIVDSPVSVVTGGPGTGKTTLVRAMCLLADRMGWRCALAAPTGRAARRLAEATGRTAKTLHRTLEFSWQEGGFVRNRDNPLRADLVIVDEASMVDVVLAAALLSAIPTGCHIVFVGDADQLPSVGPGDVLADLTRSELVPVCRLSIVFRQAESSAIVRNAHRIIRGVQPERPGRGSAEDFFVVPAESAEDVLDKTLRVACERVPEAFGRDPLRDVQVIAPMHRGVVGCENLNAELQRRLNGRSKGISHRGRELRIGDRVMQTRNDYEKDVFNGDVGHIERLARTDGKVSGVVVCYDDRSVAYEQDALDALTLAYAITAHKSQGSEYPVVVIALATAHYMLLERNLLYTALTRARELAVIVCMERALRRALTNVAARRRFTRLDTRLGYRHGDKPAAL